MGNPPTTLASVKVGGQPISIELIEPPDAPASVVITWPTRSVSISPRRFPDVAAMIARLFAEAHTALAGIKARRRL
jgi:hypothetical protein